MERPFFRAFSSMGAGFRALGASLRRMEERRRTRDKGRFHNSSDETYRGKAAYAGQRPRLALSWRRAIHGRGAA